MTGRENKRRKKGKGRKSEQKTQRGKTNEKEKKTERERGGEKGERERESGCKQRVIGRQAEITRSNLITHCVNNYSPEGISIK